MKRISVISIVVVLCLFVTPDILFAQEAWQENGHAFCPQPGLQSGAVSCSDGDGGMIVAWTDERDGTPHIFAQRIDPLGRTLWNEDGVVICDYADGEQDRPAIAADGAGGAFIVWLDIVPASDYENIYAQHVDGDGIISWGEGGIPLDSGSGFTMQAPVITATEDGAAVVVLNHDKNGTRDLYAQRLEVAAGAMWAPGGIAVCTEAGTQADADAACLRGGEVVIVWRDERNDAGDIYAWGLDAAGDHLWYWTQPHAICDADGRQTNPDVAPDGGGGFYAVWEDLEVDTSGDISATRITNNGSYVAFDGRSVCDVAGQQADPKVVATTTGAIILWQDSRSGVNADIYQQTIDSRLNAQLTEGGVVVCDADGRQFLESAVRDGNDGALVVWKDERYENTFDLFAQSVSMNGFDAWQHDGVPVCIRAGSEYGVSIIDDGEGGLLATWNDGGTVDCEIMAQRIDRNGFWGYAAPEIHAVVDVPGDQGGAVVVQFGASRLDPWPEERISRYTLWRALPDGAGVPVDRAETDLWRALVAADEPSTSPIVRVQNVAGAQYYWELAGTLDAYGRTGYASTIQTWCDATTTDPAEHLFQVAAHDSYGRDWFSLVRAGASVDNLAPDAPVGLVGDAVYDPHGTNLSWAPNAEADLAGYRVYRGSTADFMPDPTRLIGDTPETEYLDTDGPAGTFWYKVVACDVHGNESPCASLAPVAVTDVDDLPSASYLAQNSPNPFNPRTSIRFAVRAGGHVRLRIYDAAGRLVRTLVDDVVGAGMHTVVWNGERNDGAPAASGIYAYRIEAGDLVETRRMLMVR